MTCKITEYELEMVVELLKILGEWTEIAYLRPLHREQQAEKAWELWNTMQHYGDSIWDMFENEFIGFCIKTEPQKYKSTVNEQ
ncbi:hypothetical protein DRN98_10310 [Methanosarcinales archaeon]|nr:MAG: hypothetical protein DRN98_10310 [Methanosarcinales archaeon]